MSVLLDHLLVLCNQGRVGRLAGGEFGLPLGQLLALRGQLGVEFVLSRGQGLGGLAFRRFSHLLGRDFGGLLDRGPSVGQLFRASCQLLPQQLQLNQLVFGGPGHDSIGTGGGVRVQPLGQL
jgi:hypothetical protein